LAAAIEEWPSFFALHLGKYEGVKGEDGEFFLRRESLFLFQKVLVEVM